MRAILQNQVHYYNLFVKYHGDNNIGNNQFKEENPHHQGAGSFETDLYGNCMKRDLKFHHSW